MTSLRVNVVNGSAVPHQSHTRENQPKFSSEGAEIGPQRSAKQIKANFTQVISQQLVEKLHRTALILDEMIQVFIWM